MARCERAKCVFKILERGGFVERVRGARGADLWVGSAEARVPLGIVTRTRVCKLKREPMVTLADKAMNTNIMLGAGPPSSCW